ncbi:MAG: protein phosphatase CheZ [Panacagrimonas sp.]
MNAQRTMQERADAATRLRDLAASMERGEDADFEMRLSQLLRPREQSLFSAIARITQNLHASLRELEFDQRLNRLTRDELPDACSRLDLVVRLTEEAAHKTLDLVERSRALADGIAASAGELELLACPASEFPLLDRVQTSVQGKCAQLRGQLSQLAQAQEYQDLTGQIIGRVIGLVHQAESALLDLLRVFGDGLPMAPSPPVVRKPGELLGPAVPGTRGAVGQQDADELLADLGF